MIVRSSHSSEETTRHSNAVKPTYDNDNSKSNAQARSLESEADDRLASLGDAEQERRAKQAELSHAQTIRNKLESLCHRLQQRADLLMEERQRLTDVEKRRRHELADEYQRTIEVGSPPGVGSWMCLLKVDREGGRREWNAPFHLAEVAGRGSEAVCRAALRRFASKASRIR